jgi:pyruvate/2-oxoglutarate dehydrogenase complex dihydrolipoamide dehydrogenase (E3) component
MESEKILVGDALDLRMEQQARPKDWVPPEPLPRYDLVVIGGGTAGLVAAHGAAGLGASVALVERRWLGGDCLVTGCVPSKALLRSARAVQEVRRAPELGVGATLGEVDFSAVMARMRRLRAEIARTDSAARLAEIGVHVFFGSATFSGQDRIEVEGRTLRFRRAILATGARPRGLSAPGAGEVPFLTSETVFSLTERPRRLIVLGAGPVGCELAQGFRRLGSEVVLIDRGRLLSRDDPEASDLLRQVFEREGIDLRLGQAPTGVRLRDQEVVVHLAETEVSGDRLLVALGRDPNVEGMGLEAAGVQVREGKLVLDERLRTTNRRIYASGDVAVPYQFTHAADATSRLVLRNALFRGRRRFSELVIPWCTFTDPEVAHVGSAPGSVPPGASTVRVGHEHVDRPILESRTDGFTKLHVDRRGRIVGATVVGAEAGEQMAEIVLAMSARLSVQQLVDAVHLYPTRSEVVRKAAEAWLREHRWARLRRWAGLALKLGSAA